MERIMGVDENDRQRANAMIFCQIPLWKFMEASLENFYVDIGA